MLLFTTNALTNTYTLEFDEPILTDLLYDIGNMHIGNLEVMEQLLLLSYHLSIESYIAKVSLIESQFETLLARVKHVHHSKKYFFGLSEICEDGLKLVNQL